MTSVPPSPSAAASSPAPTSFLVAFRRLFLIRLVGTVSLRYSYPFLPTIADGLGVGIGTMGLAVACGEVVGLGAPLIGRRLDRIGRRRGMRDGLLLAALGCALAAATPSVVGFGAALLLVATGRYFYDVSFGAWIGDEVPFARRGRLNGIGELAWSGAFLVGVPVAGLLTTVSSWRAPFAASAVLLVLFVPVVTRTLAPAQPSTVTAAEVSHARPSALHAAIFCISLGAALIFATEGAWFEADLGLTERAVSLVVIVLGIGEVVGALLSAWLADRLGKRVAMLGGVAVLAPALVGIAFVGSNQVAGVALAFLVGLGFELGFVSALPLVVEVAQERRAGALGIAVAALTGARTVAAVAGTALFDSEGIVAVVVLGVPFLVVAGALVRWRVDEPARESAPA